MISPVRAHLHPIWSCRVVLDVSQGNNGDKVVVLDPDATDGERSFLASRVVTLAWNMGAAIAAEAS